MQFHREGETVDDYIGDWRMSDQEMIELARDAVLKLGRNPSDFFADKPPNRQVKPSKMGRYTIPRYLVEWVTFTSPKSSLAASTLKVEIDANKKCIRSFFWSRPNLQKRDWPKIDASPLSRLGKDDGAGRLSVAP